MIKDILFTHTVIKQCVCVCLFKNRRPFQVIKRRSDCRKPNLLLCLLFLVLSTRGQLTSFCTKCMYFVLMCFKHDFWGHVLYFSFSDEFLLNKGHFIAYMCIFSLFWNFSCHLKKRELLFWRPLFTSGLDGKTKQHRRLDYEEVNRTINKGRVTNRKRQKRPN